MMRMAFAALIALASILFPGEVGEQAVRLGNQVQVMEQDQIVIGSTVLPWFNYVEGDVQSAIDSCMGAILFFEYLDVRIFAAHNTTCPPKQSFQESLTVDEITVNGVPYGLLTREVHKSSEDLPGYPFDVYTTNAVGLQTSLDDTYVNISWFVKIPSGEL